MNAVHCVYFEGALLRNLRRSAHCLRRTRGGHMEQTAALWLIDNVACEMKRFAEQGMAVLVHFKGLDEAR